MGPAEQLGELNAIGCQHNAPDWCMQGGNYFFGRS
jgi:hypothetical protein